MAKQKAISDGSAKAFGRRLRELRIQKTGLSQEKYADLIGIDRTVVSRTERGVTSVSLSTMVKITCGLNITLAEFFNGFEQLIEELNSQEQ